MELEPISFCFHFLLQYLSIRSCRRKRSQKPQQTQPRSVYICHISSGERRNALYLGGPPRRRRMPRGECDCYDKCPIGWGVSLTALRSKVTQILQDFWFCLIYLLFNVCPPTPEASPYTENLPGRVVCD